MGKMFDMLKEGLEEAIEYHKGKVKLRTKKVFIPDSPKNYNAKDIKNLRAKLGITQQGLASWMNVSLNTVQTWEQSKRNPSHSSLRLLEVFEKDFSLVEKILTTKKNNRNFRKKHTKSSHGSLRSRTIHK
jgi:putative transcriptional regulator